MTGTVDLGELAGPVLVCGGAYGNLEALLALDQVAGELGIRPQDIIHSGDVAAYCASPERAARLVRNRGWQAIKGNVEEQLAAGGDDCGCGFAAGSRCNVLSRQWYSYCDRALSPRSRAWMGRLPARLVFWLAGRRFVVVHGSVSETGKYMFESLPQAAFEAEMDLLDCDGVIAGHTGLAFTRVINGRVWHNSGALGMPANDGTVRVWYSLMTVRDDAIEFSHHGLFYDYQATVGKMRTCGLPEDYARALESGLWPALDILPQRETAAAGVRRQPGSVMF